MEEVSGEGSAGFMVERSPGEVSDNAQASTLLTVSASFKEGSSKGLSLRRASLQPSLDVDEFINLLHGSDLVKLELNRLENEVGAQSNGERSWSSIEWRDKDWELRDPLTRAVNLFWVEEKG